MYVVCVCAGVCVCVCVCVYSWLCKYVYNTHHKIMYISYVDLYLTQYIQNVLYRANSICGAMGSGPKP